MLTKIKVTEKKDSVIRFASSHCWNPRAFHFSMILAPKKEEQALQMNEDCSSVFHFRHFKIASNTSQRGHFSFLTQIDVLCLL